MMYPRKEAVQHINEFGRIRKPFIFFTDFLGSRCYLKPLEDVDPGELLYKFPNSGNCAECTHSGEIDLRKFPKSLEEFHHQFDGVVREINYGNSFLVNLTVSTEIKVDLSLEEIFRISKAKYRLWFRDRFVVFSPERFVKISEGSITSTPMKGTIDANIDNAAHKILNDPKEKAEHVTIVDLIRNDLSLVSCDVEVSRFRYIEAIETHEKRLLQVSSEIKGKLEEDWNEKLGDIIFKLLPAGSISGAPKQKTIDIIQSIEDHDRNFYTGICGVYDGSVLDTGVMIRFIERQGDRLFFKSGGGITSLSKPEAEYQETIDKVYVPIY